MDMSYKKTVESQIGKIPSKPKENVIGKTTPDTTRKFFSSELDLPQLCCHFLLLLVYFLLLTLETYGYK
jgi:hypothetical protein